MNGKRIIGFLVMKPAWSSRNITSLALVALFFGVYVAAGGKITAVPKVKQGAGFGTLGTDSASSSDVDSSLDATTADDLADSEALPTGAINSAEDRKSLSLQDEEFSLKPKRVDERPLKRNPRDGENPPTDRSSGKPIDDLSDIEARLNIGRKGTK